MSAPCPYLEGKLLIRNQQVAGSNPAGGSRKSNRFNRFFNLGTLFVRATAKSLPIRFGFVQQIRIALIDVGKRWA